MFLVLTRKELACMELAREALVAIPVVSLSRTVSYLFFAGTVWILFYEVFRGPMRLRKIAPRFPNGRQIGWEILYSLRSLVVFGVVGGLLYHGHLCGWTCLYWHIDDY